MKCLVFLLAAATVIAQRKGAINISAGRPFFDPEFCYIYPDTQFFVHDNCDQYWECDEDFNLIEGLNNFAGSSYNLN